MSQEELKNKATAKKEAPAKKADTKKKSKFRLKVLRVHENQHHMLLK
jgi:hypothetical protein